MPVSPGLRPPWSLYGLSHAPFTGSRHISCCTDILSIHIVNLTHSKLITSRVISKMDCNDLALYHFKIRDQVTLAYLLMVKVVDNLAV